MLLSVRSTLSWPNLFLLEDNCAFFWLHSSFTFNPGSFGKFSKYIYFWNLEPYICYFPYDPRWVGRTSFCWRTIVRLLFGGIPPSLSTQDRLENSLSIFTFGILSLTCYFPYDPRWVGQTFLSSTFTKKQENRQNKSKDLFFH